MPKLANCLSLAVALLMTGALAHPGHDSFEPMSRPQVIERAEAIVAQATANNGLHSSWTSRQLKDASTLETPNGPVWMVVFLNTGEPDKSKKTVYLFLDQFGNYIGASFTGPPRDLMNPARQ